MSTVQSTVQTVRAKDAANFLSIGESTLWLWTKQGKLPPGIRLSSKCTVWRVSDLEAFLVREAAEGDRHPKRLPKAPGQ